MTPTKYIPARADHRAFREDLIAVLKKHEDLSAMEQLALAAHLVGQLVALQDQRIVTPEMAMTLVAQNIAKGNQEVLDGILDSRGSA